MTGPAELLKVAVSDAIDGALNPTPQFKTRSLVISIRHRQQLRPSQGRGVRVFFVLDASGIKSPPSKYVPLGVFLFTSRIAFRLSLSCQQVLVWDEDAVVRHFLHEFIQSFGYVVPEPPATVGELLAALVDSSIKVIVIAANAHTVALQVASEVRQRNPRTPLLVSTRVRDMESLDPFFSIRVSAVIERSTSGLGKIAAALQYMAEKEAADIFGRFEAQREYGGWHSDQIRFHDRR